MASNTNLKALFTKASKLERQATSNQPANSFKVYKDRLNIASDSLKAGDKVLVKATKDAVLFTLDTKGNRQLVKHGNSLQLTLNAQARKIFSGLRDKGTAGTCYELKQEKHGNQLFYMASVKAKVME